STEVRGELAYFSSQGTRNDFAAERSTARLSKSKCGGFRSAKPCDLSQETSRTRSLTPVEKAKEQLCQGGMSRPSSGVQVAGWTWSLSSNNSREVQPICFV